MNGSCMICKRDEEVRHFNLYVSGSEGLTVCHACEMDIVMHIRNMIAVAGRSTMVMYKHMRDKDTPDMVCPKSCDEDTQKARTSGRLCPHAKVHKKLDTRCELETSCPACVPAKSIGTEAAEQFTRDMQLHASPRDWPDDFPMENGAYHGRCVVCHLDFVGHKGRGVCRVCAGGVKEAPMTHQGDLVIQGLAADESQKKDAAFMAAQQSKLATSLGIPKELLEKPLEGVNAMNARMMK